MRQRSIKELQYLQALPLSVKVRMTQQRLREWVDHYGVDGVYVAFSGGKDSTVLLTIARQMYPDIKAVFADTGLEYPEIREFVRTFDNVEWIKPKMTFRETIEKYGYPMISKEVSECVWGARKYLTSVIQENSLDRPTDTLTPTEWKSYADIKASRTNIGGGRENEYRRVRGLGLYARESALISQALSTAGVTKAIDNVRVQRLMNILSKDGGKATAESIPSNRSMFSCERYQFFLDAPFEIGQQCCRIMKKTPFHQYERETGRVSVTAMMASESKLRTQKWLQQGGCNAFEAKKPSSMPMSFWLEQDVLEYIYENHIPIAKVYGDVVIDYKGMGQLEGQMSFSDLGIFDTGRPLFKTTGCNRTGCMFCGFGCHLEKPGEGRFEKMKETHPKQYEYIMRPREEGGLGYKEVIDWINENGNLNIRY